MNLRNFLTVNLTAILMSLPLYSEPLPDRFIGKVIILNSEKLDAKAKKELTAIAAKINKTRQKGTVKLTGNVPSAVSEDDYILKAAFMARNVEAHIKPLLSGKYQIYIAASKYSTEKKTAQNSVEITLYPHELKVESEGFTSARVSSGEEPQELAPLQDLPAQPVYQQPAQSGLLSPPADDNYPVDVTSKKERIIREIENPALANELVIRAKARAAEKAKRLEQGK